MEEIERTSVEKSGKDDAKRKLFEEQKKTLDLFLERGAITKAQYDKSFNTLKEKMGF